jgi:hypothetical protein
MFGVESRRSIRVWELRLKRVAWVLGFFAALSLKAGNFLGKGDIHASRVGEQPSSPTDPGHDEDLVAPAQQPGASLADQVDPNFKGNRGPGLGRPAFRFENTGVKNQYLLKEVDPNGDYRHLKNKVNKIVTGEELGLPTQH